MPGSVAGLETAHEKYGTMTREELIAPAMRLAQDGFVLEAGDADSFEQRHRQAGAGPGGGGDLPERTGSRCALGATLVQADLAATLKAISDDGVDAFYKGDTADLIVKASAARGRHSRRRRISSSTRSASASR